MSEWARFARSILVGALAGIVTASGPAWSSTSLVELRYSTDITIDLDGLIVEDEDVVVDDLAGSRSAADPASPAAAGADLDALHTDTDGALIVSYDTTVTVGGITASDGDLLRVDGVGAVSLAFDADANGFPSAAGIDAASRLPGGDWLLSPDVTVDLGGSLIDDEDLVHFDGVSYSLYLDASQFGVPVGLDLVGAHYLSTPGTLLLVFDGAGLLGGVAFGAGDVLELDPSDGTWSSALSLPTASVGWLPAARIDALFADAGPQDADGDGVPAGLDCDDTNADIAPGAEEINDGLDNQCPGDPGYGVVDELESALTSLGTSTICWDPQPGATAYEVALSNSVDFSTCVVNTTITTTCFAASTILDPGDVEYRLVRAASPNPGSWGLDSSGIERTMICP